MGAIYDALCRRCKQRFQVTLGPGFLFHILHCNQCCREKRLSVSELIEAGIELDDSAAINRRAGACRCGGAFQLEAAARCTFCHSTEWDIPPDSTLIRFD